MKQLLRKLLLVMFAKKFNVEWDRSTVDDSYDELCEKIINFLEYEI